EALGRARSGAHRTTGFAAVRLRGAAGTRCGRGRHRRRFGDLGGSGEEFPLVDPGGADAVGGARHRAASRAERPGLRRWGRGRRREPGLECPHVAVRVGRVAQDGDTLDYRETRGGARVLEAEWRREGKVLARSRTEFDAQRMPARARMDFPEERARFELTVVMVDTAAVLDPAIWRGRR